MLPIKIGSQIDLTR